MWGSILSVGASPVQYSGSAITTQAARLYGTTPVRINHLSVTSIPAGLLEIGANLRLIPA
jgi:hypothetical protein